MLTHAARSLFGGLVLMLVFATTSFAGTTHLLNFDVDQNGNPVADGTLLNVAYSNVGATFGADDVIRTGSGGVPSLPNFATGASANFSSPLNIVFDGVANFVEAANVTNSAWTLTVFDINGNVLGSASASVFGQIVNLSFAGLIKSAQFTTTTQYGIDNLRFEVENVPEPTTLVLLGTGLFGIAARIRKRRSAKE